MSAGARITLLPGDGIGPEVTAAAQRALESLSRVSGLGLELDVAEIGAAALRSHGTALPPATLAACESSDAIFLGAVGSPSAPTATEGLTPEQALLTLRRHFELFANLRPVPRFEALTSLAPLKAERLDGVDLLFVRELNGGLYYGRRAEQSADGDAFDTLSYSDREIHRIAKVAFELAGGRRQRVTSVDKANVLASMRQWRRAVTAVGSAYPAVQLEHCYVDRLAMDLLHRPADLDVVLTGNLFGDILSDEAAAIAGSLGLLPSASLGASTFGLYEPVHGSAPDIAGAGLANPIGALLSVALLARHSLGLEELAVRLESAVDEVLAEGLRTPDIAEEDSVILSSTELAAEVTGRFEEAWWQSRVPLMVV
ncbi:MAG: 3-isopropylmalate dehydrogenase [Acidobacteriota bacterium]